MFGLQIIRRYSHQLTTGISFGLTSGVITALGMIVGLHTATSSRLAVIAGIIVMSVADGLADAAGVHLCEESEVEKGKSKHSAKEIWITTFVTFISVAGFILTFAVPVLIFPLEIAVPIAIGWGMSLLVILNFAIARIKKVSAVKLICEHILLAVFIIIASFYVGNLIARWVK
ncbi:MAG: hypothetical protein ABIC18_04660 [Candidatus Omnitrophota bacterium]